MLPLFIKILILTNKTIPKPFKDGGNELSLYEPMKNSQHLVNSCSVILKRMLSYPLFLIFYTMMVYPP